MSPCERQLIASKGGGEIKLEGTMAIASAGQQLASCWHICVGDVVPLTTLICLS